MILDRIAEGQHYAPMHPLFARALAYLRDTDLKSLPIGKYELDGDRLFVLTQRPEGRTRAGAKLEAHRKYIDIQYVIEGNEAIGWRPTAECSQVELAYDSDRDVALFTDKPVSWFEVPPGSFSILWPHDAHAPLAAEGPVHKAVVKVAVDG